MTMFLCHYYYYYVSGSVIVSHVSLICSEAMMHLFVVVYSITRAMHSANVEYLICSYSRCVFISAITEQRPQCVCLINAKGGA